MINKKNDEMEDGNENERRKKEVISSTFVYLNGNEAFITHTNRFVEVKTCDGCFLRGAGTAENETAK